MPSRRRDLTKVEVAPGRPVQEVDDAEAQWIADDVARDVRLGNLRGFTDFFDEVHRSKSRSHDRDPDDPDGEELTAEEFDRTLATARAVGAGVVSQLRELGALEARVRHVDRDRWKLGVRFRDGHVHIVDLEELRQINEDPDGTAGRKVVSAVCDFLVRRAA